MKAKGNRVGAIVRLDNVWALKYWNKETRNDGKSE
jgi:hypothetical protein